tara:strand:- start:20411 stop:23188 length:2778 start_codon:yes stop_codon:yes gene_type:complete
VAEVYIEGKKLDVFQGFKFSFNYSIADIRHPEKRSTTYSKTIQCPGTQTNDEIFGQIYDFNIANGYDETEPNIDVNFNPNKKAEASVQADGVEVMRGSIQLRKIKRKKSDYIYEVVFVGRLVDIFGVLGDKQLSGLDNEGVRFIDFSDLNHVYSYSNQVASWTAPFGSGYVYPMLDYGKQVNYTSEGLRIYSVEEFKPATYLKDILDRIFAFAGFSYSSSFLSSAFFKRLIVPFSKQLELGETETTSRKFKAVKSIDQIMHRLATTSPQTFGNEQLFVNWGVMAKVCFEDDSILGFDNNDNFRILSTPTFLYNYNAENNYIFLSQGIRSDVFRSSLDLKITKNHALGRSIYRGTAQIIYKNDSSQSEEVIGETAWSWDLDALSIGSSAFQTILIEGSTSDNTFGRSFNNDQVYVRLVANDIDEGFTPDFRNTISGTFWLDYRITGGYLENEPIVTDFYEGSTVSFNDIAPEVGMSDLLLSVINMFNLYVLPDPDNDKNLLIETRDDFYEAGSVKDWTHKVDHSKELTLEPLALLTANEYEYTYTEDEDYYNERYQDSHGHAYGRARIDIDNDFLNNTNTTEVVFSPTPLVNDNPSNRIIGKIYDSDIEEGAQPTDHNTRVLYYGGLLDSNPGWIHAEAFTWHYPLQYPYAGHLTHPLAPAQDINFGVPNELFYSQNSYTGTLLYTNDNLFNRYHRRGLLEATNKDSKMLTAYLYLEPLDIHKLDFRDQIVIDNSYWRINRIMDYNPFSEGLTKVELIKVITKEPLKVETFNVGSGGTTGTAGNIEKKPINRRSLKNGNSLPLFGGVVRGTDNRIEDGVTSFMVQGNRNRIKKGSEDITISGDDNTVEGGLRGVRLINTNGVTVTESNVTFVNNRQQESSEVLDGGLDTVRRIGGGSNIFTVDGGLNIVQAQFSETSIYIVEGGQD